MTQNELNKILELHTKWLNGEADGKRANLSHADLNNAFLYRANLCGADLSGADLSGAALCHANLYHANLSDADLSHANLYRANLFYANLSDADLSYAYLSDADLSHANLSNAKIDFPLACPETGSFEAWKKVISKNKTEFLVKLLVPADAKRSSATTNKCRCEFADVLEITNIETNQAVQLVENMSYFPTITYRVGERVCPDSYDDNRWNECSHGIHFFVNKQSAIDY